MYSYQPRIKKAYGFYVMLFVAALTIATALMYMNSYQKLEVYMSWPAVGIMVGGAALALILSIAGLDDLGTGILALVNLVGLLLFVQVIYGYVVVVLVGIDLNSFDDKFITCTTLFAVSFVASVVTMFLPQKKIMKIW